MNATGLSITVAIALGLNSVTAQSPHDRPTPPPGRTDPVVVQGCISGGMLKELRAQKTEAIYESETPAVYRLTGEKKLLQLMEKQHKNEVLDVTGLIVANGDSSSTARSKQMGKLRVYATDGREETTTPGRSSSYPTLKVTAFEVVRPGCPRR
jgi:hypothetical protein